MKLVVISDVHADALTAGIRRFDEVQASVLSAMNAAIDEHADVFAFCGDLCDPDAGSPVARCIELAVHVARTLEEKKIVSFWLAGNHDTVEDGTGATTIDPIRALARSSRHVFAATEPAVWIHRGVEFVCLPYPSHATSYDPDRAVQGLRTRIGPLVVLTHLQIRDMIPGEESVEMPRGREVWFPEEEIAHVAKSRPTLVIAGHYHRRQVFTTKSGLPIQIVGSIAQFSHGEDRGIPGYLVVDVPE